MGLTHLDVKISNPGKLGKPKVHFLHIGKTGGTSIMHTINQFPANNYKVIRHDHKVRLRDLRRREPVFFFLRDPISRFVSGFNSRYRQGIPRYFRPWNENEKISFHEFTTPNKLGLAIFSTKADLKKRAQKAMKSIRHVNHSYWDCFESESYFRSRLSDIIFIGFQDNFVKDFEILKTKLGLSKNARLPNDDIQKHRSLEYMNTKLSVGAIANLKHWYKDDFQFIVLCKQLMKDGRFKF